MVALLRLLLGTLVRSLRSRSELMLENLARPYLRRDARCTAPGATPPRCLRRGHGARGSAELLRASLHHHAGGAHHRLVAVAGLGGYGEPEPRALGIT
jgi:hypothetical protein